MATIWQIGDRIQSRWEIHKILAGGMGIVYVVYDHEWREPFAAKTFQDEIFVRNPTIADRFMQETLTWINLDAHQNVTEARFVQKIEGKPYLFLEYVSGGDLSRWIRTPRLTEDCPQVLRFAIGFCDGIAHALSKGIAAHRDIKPANCLITPEGTLKVTDFGLARVFDDAGVADSAMPHVRGLSINLTRTGEGAGTPPYMAPEQFADARHVDVRADVYSFGVMLYEMIAGRLPFVGRSWEELKLLHMSQPAPKLGLVSQELSEIVRRCLAKRPEQRYGEFQEVRAELAAEYERLTGARAPDAVRGAVLSAEQWGNKGASLEELGRYDEALVCFDRVLALNPRLQPAWLNKGIALNKSGRHEEALVCFDHALALNPRFALAWCNKGVALNKLGRSEEALVCDNRSLEINPRDEQTWYNKAVVLYGLGRPEEALTCYDNALALNSQLEQAWYNKGVVLYGLGRPEEALTCYDKTLALNPSLQQAWYNKGVAPSELGRPEEALTCYDNALALNPRLEQAWYNKGNSLRGLGRRGEALASYERALAINPRFAEAWFNAGAEMINGFQRYREALPYLEEARRLGVPQAAQVIAFCRQKLGS